MDTTSPPRPAPGMTRVAERLPTALWQPLDGGGQLASLVGGKAAALDRLVAASAPVPRAAALTVDAYQCFVEAAGLGPRLAVLSDAEELEGANAAAEDVAEAFLRAGLPAPVRDAIRSAFEHISGGGTVAVRSSAVAEDSASASFAGQHRTLLDIDAGGVEEAVRLCWASLWTPHARAYRRAKGLADADLAMGVVIQSMIAAEWSGVAFTVDPTTADSDLMRVEVVEGLGERLVSGELTPDVFHLRRDNLATLETDAPPFLAEVGRRALEIEHRHGGSQDVEWSVAAGQLYILQARPITAGHPVEGDGFDTAPIPGAQFTPAGIAEMLPGVLPPLLWTSNAPMLEDAFASLFRRLGIRLPSPAEPMVGRFGGQAALNLSRLKAAARQMPRGAGAEVERQYLGRALTDDVREAKPTLRQRAGRARSAALALRLRRQLPRDCEVFLQAAGLALELQPDLQGAPTPWLVAYRRRVRELAYRGVGIEVAVAASAAANYRGLEVVLERWLGPQEASLAAQRLTAGSVREQAGGCAALELLWDVHCEQCQLPEVAQALHHGELEDTEQRLRAVGENGAALLNMVEDGLLRAGSAAVYAGRTWDEDRDSFWALLRRCDGSDPEQGPSAMTARAENDAGAFLRALEGRLTRSWKWRVTRVFTGQIVDVRRRLLRRMVADTALNLSLREAVKAALLRVGGEERRVVRELTTRLVDHGRLESEGDEWLLSDEELDSMALGRVGPDADALGRRRRAWDRARRAPSLPELFSGTPDLDLTPTAEAVGNLLHGWATSAGRVTGRALVVGDLADARDITREEILVGHSTDPSWTPLFLTVAGIVMEQGGPLSHAAIVAREFGVPAVLNVSGATRRIRTGMTITVDGTRGTVEIHDEGLGEAA